jgi:hypothetical protein
MVWWALILAGLGVIIYAVYYTEKLQRDYHESLPTALMIGGGLSVAFGVLYYTAYSKGSFGLYFLGNFLREITKLFI